MFDPSTIPDDACNEGHLDQDPIYQVLLELGQKQVTGRLTIADAVGDNHMYFMQGRPVGVHLAEHFHPLGQLLLELGRMSGATFVKAQRLIVEGNRLPGQVYKELGILDESGLKDVLAIQARRKAEHFCRLGSRPFRFCRGLSYLTGFTSTPLDAHAVIFLAIRQQMGEQAREAYLERVRNEQVRLVPPGAPPGGYGVDDVVPNFGLPASLDGYGFGPPEERFLQRLLVNWVGVVDLAETGTLPRDEMAVLLRYLEVVGRLKRRQPPPAPAPLPEPPTPTAPLAVPEPFTRPQPAPAPMTTGPTPVVTSSATARPATGEVARSPREITGVSAADPALRELQKAPLTEPTSDDVFSRPSLPRQRPSLATQEDVDPDAPTDPRRPVTTRDAVTAEDDGMVFAQNPAAPTTPNAARPARNPALDEPTPQTMPTPSIVVSEELPAPVVRKKKVKRTEPLPSEGSGLLVSEVRREKTMIAALPSIVIDDE